MSFPYHVGLTVPLESPAYVRRAADQELYEALLAGEFCYVLTSRQMGKSSLRVQVMQRLKDVGVNCSAIDLTGIGSKNITSDQWYRGIMNQILKDLQLTEHFDLTAFCDRRSHLGWVQRLSDFVDEILLDYLTAPLVVFVDEIDSTISLGFDSDDFFAWIRYCCNQRADFAHYQRLAFCLLGVATPADLIQDGTRTPFNLGKPIELERFSLQQVESLSEPLADQFADLGQAQAAIYEWTGGQPFLTQRLCQMIQESDMRAGGGLDAVKIEELVRQRVVINCGSQDQKSHLQTIRSRLLSKDEQAVGLLSLYQRVLAAGAVLVDGEDLLEVMALRLTGLVVSERGSLVVYNRLYGEVFDDVWVEQELAKLRPYAGSLERWLAGGREDGFLLAGQRLVEAQQWAMGRRLSEVDYQYLTASQRLDTDRVKAEAEQEVARVRAEAKQVKADTDQVKAELEQIVDRARRTAIRWTLAGVGGFVMAVMAMVWAGHTYNEGTWKTMIEQETEDVNEFPLNSLNRLKAAVKVNRKFQAKFRDINFASYFTHNPIKSLQGIFIARWHESNIIELQDLVFSVAMSGDGQTIISGSGDKRVKIWDRDGTLLNTLPDHQDSVNSVAVSGDGQTIASGSKDKTVKIRGRDGTLVTTLSGHQDSVSSVALSGDGQTIVSGSKDKTVKVWRRDGTLLNTLSGHQDIVSSVAVSRDGQTIISGSDDKTVKIWGRDGSFVTTFPGHQSIVRSVAVSRDGQTIVSGSDDKTVKIWGRDGSLINTLSGHQDSVNSVAVSADGQTIVSGSDDKTVKVWGRDGSLINTLPGHQNSVNSVAVSDDGQTIASGSLDGQTIVSGSGVVKIWRRNGSLLTTLSDHQNSVNSVAVSLDGQTIVSGSDDKTVKIWGRDGTLLNTFPGHQNSVNSVAVNADGQTIASGSKDKTVKVWGRDGSLLNTLSDHQDIVNSVAVSLDGQTIVSGSKDKTVKVWGRDGTLLNTLPGHQNSVNSVAVSADGQTIVSGSLDNTVKIWGRDGSLIKTFPGHQDSVNSVAVSVDGQTIVSGSDDKTVKVWGRDGSLINTLPVHQNSVNSVAVSADGQTIVSRSDDKTVKVWRRDGSWVTTLSGHQDIIRSVAVSRDGQTIVSGSDDKTVKIWHFDLNYLLGKGCEQLQDYLNSHLEVDRSQLCPK